MRRFIFGIVALVVASLFVGPLWNSDHHKDSGMDSCLKKLASQAAKIEMLEDSIKILNDRLIFYEGIVQWFQITDSEEVERAVHVIYCR